MPAIASLNGSDMSGTYYPKSPNDGSPWYDTTARCLRVYDDTLKTWVSDDPIQTAISAGGGGFWDDFRRSSINPQWTLANGSDAQAADAVVAGGDRVDLVTGDAGTGFAADGTLMTSIALGTIAARTSGKPWVIPFKVKISAITNVSFFVGLTDTAAFEEVASLSSTTFTTTATDAAIILFDTGATTDTTRLVAVNTNTDATHVDTGAAPVADTYESWRLEINSSGDVAYYKEGTLVGTLLAALSTAVPLYFVAGATARSTASRTLSLDYAGVN